MPNDTYHVNASGNAFVHVGDNYQTRGDAQRGKLLDRLLPNWQSNKSLELYWDHHQALRKHVGKTCQWIYETVEFQSWILERNGVLWLHGLPGCEGLILSSSTIIEYLRSSLSDDNSYVAGYYFNAREDEKITVARLMSSILLQLLPTQGELPPEVDQLCNDTAKGISEQQLLLALQPLVRREQQTYIVIDALDECDTTFRTGEDSEVEKLESFLEFLLKKSRNIHLLVTSRDGGLERRLETRLRGMISSGVENGLPHYHFDLQTTGMKQRIGNDISELVTAEVERWNDRRGRRRWLPLDNNQQSLVTDSVKERANGMFRLAACLLDLLWRKDTWEELKLALSDLPTELIHVYDRIFEEIDDQGQLATANNLLKWILYSQRPLALPELIQLTMVDNQGISFSIENRAQDGSYVSTTLSSFITISEDGLVQFAHQTVQEYLLSDHVQSGHFSRRRECSRWITRCCLSYMYFCAHDADIDISIQKPLRERLPLLEYVFNNWYCHLLELLTRTMQDDGVLGEVSAVLSNHPSRVSSMAPGNVIGCEDPRRSLCIWILEAISWFDQVFLLRDSPPLDIVRDITGQGYEKCIRFLILSFNPAIPLRASLQNNILKAAMAGRYREIIQILVDDEFQGWNNASWWTPTGQSQERQAVKHRSYKTIVQVLLEHGVDANSPDSEDGWTPLHLAAFQGSEEVIELLLNHGADPVATDYCGRTPLHVASSRGHDVIVQLWLDKGFPIETKDNMGWTALDRVLQRVATEITVQHLPTAAKTTQDSLAAEYSGTLAIPQLLESNCKSIARTVELLLDSKIASSQLCIERPLSIDDESNETQPNAVDQNDLTTFSGTANDIVWTEGCLRIGFSLLETVVKSHGTNALGPLPLLDPVPLRRWPRRHSMNLVKRLHINGGFVHVRRCFLESLVMWGGTMNLTMADIHVFKLDGGDSIFLSPPRIDQLVMSGGTALFKDCLSTSYKPDHPTPTASAFGGSSRLPELVQLKDFIANDGVATFVAPVEVKRFVMYGGTVTFRSKVKVKNMVLNGGCVTFAEEFYLENMVIYAGYFNALATGEVNNLVIYHGCSIFASGCSIKNMVVYGGYSNFLSAAEVETIVQYEGRIDFLQNTHRELFRIVYGGISTLEVYDESTTTAAVYIHDLVVYGGLFNSFSRYEVKRFQYFGGDVTLYFDGVLCALAGCGQVDLARTLLKRGASPLEASPGPRLLTMNGGQSMEVDGWTALHEAAFKGQEAFVRMLLEERSHQHHLIQDGLIPEVLEIATLQGHISIVELLGAATVQAVEVNGTLEGSQGCIQRYVQRICGVFQNLLQ